MPDDISGLPAEIQSEIEINGGLKNYLELQKERLSGSWSNRDDVAPHEDADSSFDLEYVDPSPDSFRHVDNLVVGPGGEVSISGRDINKYRVHVDSSSGAVDFSPEISGSPGEYPHVSAERSGYTAPAMPQGATTRTAGSWDRFKLRALKFVANHPKVVKVAGVVIGVALGAAFGDPFAVAGGAAIGFVMADMAVRGARSKLQSLEKDMSGPAGATQVGPHPHLAHGSNSAVIANKNRPEVSERKSVQYAGRLDMANAASLRVNKDVSPSSSPMASPSVISRRSSTRSVRR
ncbi:hypothetical protein [Streptomyces sp. NPDC029554]|uniref:hypothetical protein n=1 Tax=Streptomyces sp. NPDC029554 TaxID=3155126 RepID=UPI0034058FDE